MCQAQCQVGARQEPVFQHVARQGLEQIVRLSDKSSDTGTEMHGPQTQWSLQKTILMWCLQGYTGVGEVRRKEHSLSKSPDKIKQLTNNERCSHFSTNEKSNATLGIKVI